MQKRNIKIIILVTGIAFGVLSSITDHLSFGNTFFIIGGFLNSASFWSLSAFLIGTRFSSRRSAIFFPIAFLCLSVASYYIAELTKNNISLILLFAMAISWLIIAILLGALCGLAGRTAAHTKNLKKRMIAVTIPMVIIITESLISIVQIIPYLKNGNTYYIPFIILSIFCICAFCLPFIIFVNKKLATYTATLGLFISVICSVILMILGNR